jgi:hypothetical protein
MGTVGKLARAQLTGMDAIKEFSEKCQTVPKKIPTQDANVRRWYLFAMQIFNGRDLYGHYHRRDYHDRCDGHLVLPQHKILPLRANHLYPN